MALAMMLVSMLVAPFGRMFPLRSVTCVVNMSWSGVAIAEIVVFRAGSAVVMMAFSRLFCQKIAQQTARGCPTQGGQGVALRNDGTSGCSQAGAQNRIDRFVICSMRRVHRWKGERCHNCEAAQELESSHGWAPMKIHGAKAKGSLLLGQRPVKLAAVD